MNGGARGGAKAAGMPEAVGAKAMYARPLSPTVIRQIIREELSAAANERVEFETNPVKDADTASSAASTTDKNRASYASGMDRNKADDGGLAHDAGMSPEEKARKGMMVDESVTWQDPEKVRTATTPDRPKTKPEAPSKEPATMDAAVSVSCNYIFGGFSRRSPIRLQCFEIKKNLWWQGSFLCITIANSLWILLAPELSQNRNEDGGKGQLSPGEFWFDVICAGVMGFEILVGIVAYGFVQSETTYLRNSGFHKLDFACFIATILEYVGNFFNMPNATLRPFRMLRIFKPITKIKSFIGVKSIMSTLKEGSPQLVIVFMFMLLTLTAWCILVMAVFSKSFRRRCVTFDTKIPVCASDFSTDFNATCNFTFDRYDMMEGSEGTTVKMADYPFEQWCDIVALEAEYDYAQDEWIPPVSDDPRMIELFEQFKDAGNLAEQGYYDKTGMNAIDAILAYPKDKYGRWHTCQRDVWLKVPFLCVCIFPYRFVQNANFLLLLLKDQ